MLSQGVDSPFHISCENLQFYSGLTNLVPGARNKAFMQKNHLPSVQRCPCIHNFLFPPVCRWLLMPQTTRYCSYLCWKKAFLFSILSTYPILFNHFTRGENMKEREREGEGECVFACLFVFLLACLLPHLIFLPLMWLLV